MLNSLIINNLQITLRVVPTAWILAHVQYFGTTSGYLSGIFIKPFVVMLDFWTRLMLAAMGASLIDNVIENDRMKNEERRRDSLFWQEAIRKKYDTHDDCEDEW